MSEDPAPKIDWRAVKVERQPRKSRPKPPTAEEIEAAAKRWPPLVSADENRHPHPRRAERRKDEAGEPCACGPAPGQVCLLHHALTGHRRHVRP
jgi:hypothetical protein